MIHRVLWYQGDRAEIRGEIATRKSAVRKKERPFKIVITWCLKRGHTVNKGPMRPVKKQAWDLWLSYGMGLYLSQTYKKATLYVDLSASAQRLIISPQWLCCSQTGSRGQRRMETQRKGVRNLLYSRRILMIIITLRASCGAVYCNRSCLWVCLRVCVWDDWKGENGKLGTVENAGVENARTENAAPKCRGGKGEKMYI